MTAVAARQTLPDMDSPERIRGFVEAFYGQMLEDKELGPIFLSVAEVDLDKHLPLICSYWEKLLLGDRSYQRHTMNIHRAVNHKQQFSADNFQRWLHLYTSTLDALFQGPIAERARGIATRIAGNMAVALEVDAKL